MKYEQVMLACDLLIPNPEAREQVRSLLTDTWAMAIEEAAREVDRFTANVSGFQDERHDGAFVAMTRLAKSIRSMKPPPTAAVGSNSTKEK